MMTVMNLHLLTSFWVSSYRNDTQTLVFEQLHQAESYAVDTIHCCPFSFFYLHLPFRIHENMSHSQVKR